MERLLEELTRAGVLDPDQAGWADTHRAERGGSLPDALLELDLIDEHGLLSALGARFGKPSATPDLLEQIDPEIASRLPAKFSQSFRMCPLRFEAKKLLVLVEKPLPAEWVAELAELLGAEIEQFVCPSHYLRVARAKLYGGLLDDRSDRLEARLAQLRRAPDVVSIAAAMSKRKSLAEAADDVLDYAACLVDFSCFATLRDGRLHLLGPRRSAISLPAPEPGCTLGPAIAHGGYFLGALALTNADRRFYRQLGRAVPKRAFVAPVPITQTAPVVLYVDNETRGIATRWIAELTMLVVRLGRQQGSFELRSGARPTTSKPPRSLTPAGVPVTAHDLEEREVLARLRGLAEQAGVGLTAFVDSLLASRASAPSPSAAAADKVDELFQRLASDIPAHLVRGIELAFRELGPRLAAAGASPSANEARPAPAPAALVASDAPRHIESYAARRKKCSRVQL